MIFNEPMIMTKNMISSKTLRGNIKMVHVMSEEEIEESNRKIEEWWNDLERSLKVFLHQTNKKHFEQMYCVHEFETNDNIDFEYCTECNLSKDK